MTATVCFLLAACLFICDPVWAAQDTIGNIRPDTTVITPGYAPGSWVILPDNTWTQIRTYLPDGRLVTEEGIILLPDGTIVEGENRGKIARLPEEVDSGARKPEAQTGRTPEKEVLVKPEIAVGQKPEPAPVRQPQTVIRPQTQAEARQNTEPERPLTITELLPMTRMPEERPYAGLPENQGRAVAEKPQKPAFEKPEKQAKKQGQPEKPVPEPKKEQPVKAKKPAAGQELRIPPEAVKTGNLDFLEGCWQGTRPEYRTKRTIKECFCFGKNGRNGKRRIFDTRFHRMCIGGAKATLSKSGLLSVTSSGGACNDGESWGSARMQCQNSGPRTPCSWIFPDALGGQQSYVIPFVRVESCGR